MASFLVVRFAGFASNSSARSVTISRLSPVEKLGLSRGASLPIPRAERSGRLLYTGKAQTGFTVEEMSEMRERLATSSSIVARRPMP
jgi:hypothetical protein